MNAKMNSLFFAFSTLLIILCLSFVFNTKPLAQPPQEEIVAVIPQEKPEIVLPTDEDIQKLEDARRRLSTYLVDNNSLYPQIVELHEQVSTAPVCSIANRNFNTMQERFDTYQQKLRNLEKQFSSYETEYNKFMDLMDNIPLYSAKYRNQYNNLSKDFTMTYKQVTRKMQQYEKEEEELNNLYLEAKQIADTFFEEYFSLMCLIVNAEAGMPKCTAIERAYVANVIENRIKSSKYPNSIHGVVYQKGQYEPVMNGSINKTPPAYVVQDVEEYLRGRIETEMPDNVFYQALFRQGKGVWKHLPSGHYFCY